ncbi:31910_t:CDS:2 [Gigaspora margarita]|uniref:31910_t:CDS:1 n=1 Tax=Gigaspora margarita TaxID=4874 RepID=A0ABN7UQK9_GIGMA|nr:31910_t:CDS:2 [Gigaspora margarita]
MPIDWSYERAYVLDYEYSKVYVQRKHYIENDDNTVLTKDASISPGHLHRRQANNTINPVSTAVGNACPTTPVVVTATVNSSTSTTVTSISTITGSTTSFVTFTATQAIPSAITTTLPPIDFSKELIPRNDTIPYEAFKAASDFKSITSKHGFSKCGGIMDIQDFRILYSASQKTFIPLFKGSSPIVVNNATGRLYVQVYGTSIALEFDGIPCFGARNASPCTSGNVIDSGNTYDQRIAKNIGSALIKYGYFSLIESLGGYAILTIQTGNNDPYLACVMTKIADDDNISDSFVTPGAATAYTATSAALGVVCLALAAGGVVTVATHSDPHNPSHTQHPHPENAPPNEKHLGGDTSIKINDHPVGNGDHPKINHEMGGGNGQLNTHEEGKGIPQPELGDHQVAEVGPPPHVQSPSFYDLIFYTQSIIATGWLTLNLTSEYRKFASTFSWGCAQGFINLNSLVSAANNLRYSICNIFINENMNTTSIPGACVDQENGYTLPPVGSNASFIFGSNFPTNSSQSVTNPYGFESYSHIIGIPVKDLPFTSMIGFLVVTAISIVLVLLSASIASIVIKYRQNAPETLKIMRDNVHLFLFVSGEAQLGCLFLIEFFYLSLLIEHKPYADKIYGNYLNISISFSRLLVVLLLVPFVKNLSNFVPPNILKIFSLTLIILQVVILALLGMIIISKLCKMLLRSYERSGCRKNRANDVDDE